MQFGVIFCLFDADIHPGGSVVSHVQQVPWVVSVRHIRVIYLPYVQYSTPYS